MWRSYQEPEISRPEEGPAVMGIRFRPARPLPGVAPERRAPVGKVSPPETHPPPPGDLRGEILKRIQVPGLARRLSDALGLMAKSYMNRHAEKPNPG